MEYGHDFHRLRGEAACIECRTWSRTGETACFIAVPAGFDTAQESDYLKQATIQGCLRCLSLGDDGTCSVSTMPQTCSQDPSRLDSIDETNEDGDDDKLNYLAALCGSATRAYQDGPSSQTYETCLHTARFIESMGVANESAAFAHILDRLISCGEDWENRNM